MSSLLRTLPQRSQTIFRSRPSLPGPTTPPKAAGDPAWARNLASEFGGGDEHGIRVNTISPPANIVTGESGGGAGFAGFPRAQARLAARQKHAGEAEQAG
ncbi:hypothetical protein GJ744_004435 [Endocarpon pusillum]|uniref:Uncharacterized protein n=1 Tax=Endocarpon pusillum TaxID=364733 RepID=A0A8H7ARG4_9EURO|nr:hypothetical protein GJ744_004435 [Endocarpon pusillum]